MRSEAGLQDALTALHREHYRSLVKLASILPESEIAATLGIAPGTVKTHARRALEALTELLEDRR